MSKGTIGILTGGGDVPGLNPAIRAITIRALRDGFKVIGIRHGWGDRKSTRLNSSHRTISYAVFCLKKKSGNRREWVLWQLQRTPRCLGLRHLWLILSTWTFFKM